MSFDACMTIQAAIVNIRHTCKHFLLHCFDACSRKFRSMLIGLNCTVFMSARGYK